MINLTLPGSIPGLLRRGSPVLVPVSVRVRALGRRALVMGHGVDHTGVLVATQDAAPYWEAPEYVALDLTDATGRFHASLYVDGIDGPWRGESSHYFDRVLGEGHYGAIVGAGQGDDLDDEGLAALRRVVLHVAGVPDA